jgi:hypothetical protein
MRSNLPAISLVASLLIGNGSLPLCAQTVVAPTEFRIRLYPPGSQAMTWESPSIPIGPPATTCGLVPEPGATGIVVNPTRLQFDDPNLVGKACVVNLAGAPNPSIPDGIYELALVGVRGGVIGGTESTRATFAKGPITIRIVSGVVFLVP